MAPRTDRFDDVACTDCHVYSGRRLVERVGCLSCHRIDGRGGRWAPELTVVGEKLRYTWLTEFLRDPERVRPGTAMPNLRLTSGQAHCIASYLAERAEVNNPHCSVGEIQEELAGTSEPGEALGEPGERRQPAPGEAERVRKLLERKRQQASRATMFWSRLQGEADALEERFGDAQVVERGREILVQARCAACHRIDGIPAAAPAELRRSSWTAFEDAHRVPKPGGSRPLVIPLDPAEADRVREFLGTLERFGPAVASLAGVDDAARTLVEGREVLERRGCMACHELHGARVELPVPVVRLAPQDPPTAGGCPPLGDAGRRLRPDWLAAFLDAPHAVRPGTTVHMPKFALSEAERTALLGFLREIAGADTVAERAPRVLDPSETARAAALFEQHGCGACHLPVEEAMHRWTLKAPLVSAMADRLRRDWAVHWLADPQAVHPGTAMPKFPLTQPERDLLVDYLLSRPQDLIDREAGYQPGANAPPHR